MNDNLPFPDIGRFGAGHESCGQTRRYRCLAAAALFLLIGGAMRCKGLQHSGDLISFNAPGGVTSPGNCAFMIQGSDGGGTGIACGVGSMTNALAGALTVVFDVNFMQGNGGGDHQNFTKNLIGFVGQQVDPPVAVIEPGTLSLLGFGLAGPGLMARRRRAVA